MRIFASLLLVLLTFFAYQIAAESYDFAQKVCYGWAVEIFISCAVYNTFKNAIGTGKISVDIGERLPTAISMYYKIYEMDLLEKRIERLELVKNG